MFWGQIIGPIYTLYLLCLLWDIHGVCVCCGIKSMVPFTSCTSVYCGIKSMIPFALHPVLEYAVGSNPWFHLHPVLVSVVGSNSCSHLHLVLVSVVGSNPWSNLHPVLVIKSMVQFTPCTCDQIHGPIYTLYLCLL